MTLTAELIDIARSAGAYSVGVTGPDEFTFGRRNFEHAIAAGWDGPLGFTYDDPGLATDVRTSIPWARSLVVFGVSYIEKAARPAAAGPVVGRFATEDFYQPVRDVASAVTARLRQLGRRAEMLIDDNRLADRSAAIRAGVGWHGRSTMVLSPGVGPWMLLGTVATDASLEPTSAMRRDCGTCTACMPACPTGAIQDSGLDARRCLSTWLQTAGSIPQWIRPVLGRRIYGCDDCLASCPPGHPALRSADVDPFEESFSALLDLDDSSLLERFSWWFVPRRDGRYLRRNLLVALGNSGDPGAYPILMDHLKSSSSMIRGHAAWAIARTGDNGARRTIRAALDQERSPEGREEMLIGLLMLEQPDLYQQLLLADETVSTDDAYSGLALVGLDVDSSELPAEGVRILSVIRDSAPGATWDELAAMVRVNDRERHVEHLRRQARSHLTDSHAR